MTRVVRQIVVPKFQFTPMQTPSEHRRQFIDGLAKALIATLLCVCAEEAEYDEENSDCYAPEVINSFIFAF